MSVPVSTRAALTGAAAMLLAACASGDPAVCVRVPGCEEDGPCCTEKIMCDEHVCHGQAWVCAVGDRGSEWISAAGAPLLPCDDANPCTTDDRCSRGSCSGTETWCPAPPAGECIDSQNLRSYQGNGTCNPQTGKCVYESVVISCPGGGCAGDRCIDDRCAGIACSTPEGPCWQSPGRCLTDTGKCVYDPQPPGVPCVSQDPCVANATCDGNGSCGGTAQSCARPHTTGGTCTQGGCAGFVCTSGWGNCNNDWNDGCEANLTSDDRNCGACGKVCQDGPNAPASCLNSQCVLECTPPWQDCNKQAADGCEVPVGQANSCSRSGLSTFTAASGATPGCGTPYCGVGGSDDESFGSWHCRFCVHCQSFGDGQSWCLTATGLFSADRCASCCDPTYPQVCQ